MGRAIPLVSIVNLGRISYNEGSKIQALLQQKHLKEPESLNHVLLLLEHNPVFTFGLREKISDEDENMLKKLGADVVKSNRGGLTTFHGPGQLVAYPVLNLQKFRNMSLRTYVNSLEMTAIHTCRMLGVPAVPGRGSVSHTGAWANDKKICAIGVHCKRYITTHGLALNCNTDLEWFQKIVPCGIPDKGVTSLTEELTREMSLEYVIPQFISSFQSIFTCKTSHDSLENLLGKDIDSLDKNVAND